MSSHVNRPQPSQPKSDAVVLGGPVELNHPTPPVGTGYDRNRLKQIEDAINERIRQKRVTPQPPQINSDR